ncbi:hypothetical protein CHARACLAT_011167 [Characodon lateralis]|uniref:Uncharacterized protein n=1 Tax=Characodon lateralis TaxID=208331 RepID=A0ABU7DU83_9TELE|nr:hypothetical protein [Characodon lateralis]
MQKHLIYTNIYKHTRDYCGGEVFIAFIVETAWGRNCRCGVWFVSLVLRSAALEVKVFNSLCPGCVGSAEMLAALFLTLDLYKSWMEVSRDDPLCKLRVVSF